MFVACIAMIDGVPKLDGNLLRRLIESCPERAGGQSVLEARACWRKVAERKRAAITPDY